MGERGFDFFFLSLLLHLLASTTGAVALSNAEFSFLLGTCL